MKTVYRTSTATLDTSAFRYESIQGREYLVVPVRLMRGDYVVSAQGSKFPELVPADELKRSATHWNGRPITTDHPADSSANTPAIWEDDRFGVMFNTKYEDGFLRPEYWFDVARAAELGGDHQQVIDNTLAGIPSEVSGGTEINLELREGVDSEGQSYKGVWRNLKPDHAAAGLGGAKGACDIAVGKCGIRTGKEKQMNLTGRDIAQMFRWAQERKAQDAGKSSNTLRDQLWDALEASSIQNFWSVRDDFQDSSTVIYSTWDFDGPILLWRHKFESTDEGVTLIGEPESVVFNPTFITVSREALTTNQDHGSVVQGGKTMNAEAVQALIDGDNGFTADDQAALESLPEGLSDKFAPLVAVPVVEEGASAEEDTPPPVEFTVPAGMAILPEGELTLIQASAKAYGDQQKAARVAHTTTLRAACGALTDDDVAALDGMGADVLERLATIVPCNVADYSGQGSEPLATDTPLVPTIAPRNACFDSPQEAS